jgi:hypothetical protein
MPLIPRVVTARLVERFIFNFRLRPNAFASRLPVPWLKPQVINGWCVTSFCILKLDRVMIWPLPGAFGPSMISCAYRSGILDAYDGGAEPSVYITDRNTDLPLAARLAPWWFADTIPMILPTIAKKGDVDEIRINYLDGQRLFYGDIRQAAGGRFSSAVFGSIDEYTAFIRDGVSSYTPSIYGDALAMVDLTKEDPGFQPMEVHVDFSWLDGAWSDAKLEYDSAVRATGGNYKWTYRGLRSALVTRDAVTPATAVGSNTTRTSIARAAASL